MQGSQFDLFVRNTSLKNSLRSKTLIVHLFALSLALISCGGVTDINGTETPSTALSLNI